MEILRAPENETERLIDLAQRLDIEQQTIKPDGVGVINSIITYLRMGKLSEARTVYLTDRDKLRQYFETGANERLRVLLEDEFMEGMTDSEAFQWVRDNPAK